MLLLTNLFCILGSQRISAPTSNAPNLPFMLQVSTNFLTFFYFFCTDLTRNDSGSQNSDFRAVPLTLQKKEADWLLRKR